MRLLAIDTSTQVMGISVFNMETESIFGSITTNIPMNHSNSLMPNISHLLDTLTCPVNEIEVFVVSSGPGSYTGVRIGVAVAKTLAWTREKPLYGVSSLSVLAMNGLRFPGIIVPLFDARRQRVYSGIYWSEQGRLYCEKEDQLIYMKELLSEIKKLDEPTLFLGDIHSYKEAIQEALGTQASFGSPVENAPSPMQLAVLGFRKYIDKEPPEDHSFAPNYCQMTEAEIKLHSVRKKDDV